MNNNEQSKKSGLIIYQKYLDFLYYSNDLIRKYPKCEQFALVKEIKNSLYSGLRYMMYAIKSYNKQEKLKYLKEIDIQLNLLKIHCRLSYKYKYITIQNYQTWSKYITDICNMLGGWINSCQRK